MSWLNELVSQHSEDESPTSFWYWSGICTISAVLKDNVWLNRGGRYNLYPNIFAILHADSGLKKGTPIALSKDLVRRVNSTKIISGRASIQGILKRLSQAQTEKGGKVTQNSTGYVVASELASSLVEDKAALTILTDLYDRNLNVGEWESLLKMEEFQLKNPTITLFGGINQAHAEGFFENKDIKGGFIARTFIVSEKEEQTINSLVTRALYPPNNEKLAEYLKELSKLNGAFTELCDDNNEPTQVGRRYDEWYTSFRHQVKESGVKDETGTLNRFGDSVLKVAMILSLAEAPKLEIREDALETAITVCEKLLGNVKQATLGKTGISSSSALKSMIIKELLERTPSVISRTMLMKKCWMHYSSAEEWDEIMQSFDQSGMIKTGVIGNQVIYTMEDEQANELRRFFLMKGK